MTRSLSLALALSCVCIAPAWAQLPQTRLSTIYPAGGKAGSDVAVSLTGADLDDVTALRFNQAGITAAPKMAEPKAGEKGPQAVPGEFTVNIKPDVRPGVYEVRAIGRYGISNPRFFQVNDQPEALEVEGPGPGEKDSVLDKLSRAQEVTIPCVINGRFGGSNDDDYFKFNAKAGQRILVDCFGQRIDSKLDATLVAFDAQGRELAKNQNANRRDPLLDFTVPADGVYTVRIYDPLYQGGPESFYRLVVGPLPRIDYVLPPAGAAGQKGKFTLYGRNLPGGTPAPGLAIDGRPLEQLAVEIDAPGGPAAEGLASSTLAMPEDTAVDSFEYRLSSPAGWSNGVLIGFATAPVVAETEPNNDIAKAQKLTVPCEVYGQFYPRRDQDRFEFEAKKGDTFVIEVMSQRLGLPTDPFLLVQQATKDDKGAENVKDLQAVDDLKLNMRRNNNNNDEFNVDTDDPLFRFTAPADGPYRVLVRDMYYDSRGDVRYLYRLSIRKETPDFRLVALPQQPVNPQQNNGQGPWTPFLRKGGTEQLEILCLRRDGFAGEVEVTVAGLPEKVACPPITIGPGMTRGVLIFKAADDAAPWSGMIQVVGKGKVGEADVTRQARAGSVVWPGKQNEQAVSSRASADLALAVSGHEAAAFSVELSREKPWGTARTGKLEIPIKVTRRGDFKGAIAVNPSGLPQGYQAPNVTIAADKTDGVLTITVPNNAPTGTFSIYAVASSQVSYKRNPDAATAAAEAKKEVDKAVTELTEANKKATEAKAAADKAAAEGAAALKKAADAKAAADKAVADMASQQKAADEKAKAASTAAAQKADDKGLQDAKAAAAKALEEATKKAADATAAASAAAQAMTDAEAKSKAAADAKAAADKAAMEAGEKLKAAQAAAMSADKTAKDLAKAAEPKNVPIFDPSTSVTITIAEAPVKVSANPPGGNLKQGDKVELDVKLERLFGYDDTVEVELNPPNGVQGLKAAKLTLAKGQSEGKLVVEAAANATPGEHALGVRATAKFNGNNLQTQNPVKVNVEKVEPPKK